MEDGIVVWKSEDLPVVKGSGEQSFLMTSNHFILRLFQLPFFNDFLEKLKIYSLNFLFNYHTISVKFSNC